MALDLFARYVGNYRTGELPTSLSGRTCWPEEIACALLNGYEVISQRDPKLAPYQLLVRLFQHTEIYMVIGWNESQYDCNDVGRPCPPCA